LVTANQLRNAFVDLGQPLWQRIARLRAYHAALDQSERAAAFLANYPVARDRGAGIDPEHDYGRRLTHLTFALVDITSSS
jgi:hypothetical protein